MTITIDLKSGYLRRQLEAVSRCTKQLADELADIPRKYCPHSGDELRYLKDTDSGYEIWACPACEYMVFKNKETGTVSHSGHRD